MLYLHNANESKSPFNNSGNKIRNSHRVVFNSLLHESDALTIRPLNVDDSKLLSRMVDYQRVARRYTQLISNAKAALPTIQHLEDTKTMLRGIILDCGEGLQVGPTFALGL